MNTISIERKVTILSLLAEGASIRSTERVTGVHRDTIMRLLVDVGERCQEFLDQEMVNLRVSKLQVDEIWSFVGKKEKRLVGEEKNNQFLGDQYVFVALDADTKLCLAHRLGKRNGQLARSFMMEVSTRVKTAFQLTTDSFGPYRDAVDRVFGDIPYAQVHKQYAGQPGDDEHRYSPPRIIRVDINPITGNPNPKYISTSYIERQNLTMRMQMRRLTRLTNAYSKKWKNLKAALALYFWWYNYGRVHETLRMTPAMAAGLTKHIWSWYELLDNRQEQIAA